MSSILDKMLEKLTDNYLKKPQSKIGKLLKLVTDEIEEIKATFETIEQWRDIDQAQGTTLDKAGKNVVQFRGVATDDVYKILIKAKIMRNLSDGGINTIIEILEVLLDIPASEVSVEELWPEEPAAIQVDVKTETVNKTGLTLSQFGKLVDIIAAGGVRANVFFEGTFQFSSQADISELDPDAGFADDDQTTGGFFGALYDPGTETLLPF
ncbi:hypothetical protein [Anaerosolibacter sp.]|uniref:hypothetical protein n=1 Tax=Anaerosolibacter sp. TaxID=1872527 RepID=UPI0039EF6E16